MNIYLQINIRLIIVIWEFREYKLALHYNFALVLWAFAVAVAVMMAYLLDKILLPAALYLMMVLRKRRCQNTAAAAAAVQSDCNKGSRFHCSLYCRRMYYEANGTLVRIPSKHRPT